jgi:hypothetical protein
MMAALQQTPRKHKMSTARDVQTMEPPRKKRSDGAAAWSLMEQPGKQEGEGLCRFFSCAREIRDLIYHHLWKDTPQMLVAWKAAGNETVDNDKANKDEADNNQVDNDEVDNKVDNDEGDNYEVDYEVDNEKVDTDKDPSRAGATISAFYDSWPDSPNGTSNSIHAPSAWSTTPC